ncbi:MAG: mannose-1-phosphate guanylyltransferase [bacterium]
MTNVAVIMAGGTGTRFWPLSRRDHPKQLLSIGDHPVMLQATVDRLKDSIPADQILIVTSSNHVQGIRDLNTGIPEDNILVEPEGRDTAPCCGLAAMVIREKFGPETVIGTFPADHRIQPVDPFTSYARAAFRGARELNSIVTFGIKPSTPATGYGYILPSGEERTIDGQEFLEVDKFTEKPNKQTAMDYIENQNALWNSGMFFWSAQRLLEEIEQHAPALGEGLDRIYEHWKQTGSLDDALDKHYGQLPEVSVDYAILENTKRCWTLPVDFNWNDLGTWTSIEDLFDPDEDGNVTNGDVVLRESNDNLVYEAGDLTIGGVGLSEMIVVASDDAVLVCPKDQDEKVKTLVNELEDRKRDDLL